MKILVSLTILIFVCATGFAQSISRANYQFLAQRDADSMKVKLNLTPTQAAHVKSIEEAYYQKLLMPDKDSVVVDARKIRIKQFQKERDDALKLVFTPGQWTLYQTRMQFLNSRKQTKIDDRKNKWKALHS